MARYLVIDHEDKAIDFISEALKSIDPQCQIEAFQSEKEFNEKITSLIVDDNRSAVDVYFDFDTIILDHSLNNNKDWAVKIHELKNQNAKKEAPIIFCGYEEGNATSIQHLKLLDIYNFIFKPFDLLILKESINIAAKPQKRAQTLEIKSQQASSMVASLKQVDLQSISELGFVTLSDSEIPLGGLAKYFSPLFTNGKKQSIWAQCLISLPHPQKPGIFINKFQYYGPDQTFLNIIRKYVRDHKADETSSALWNFNPPKEVAQQKMAVIAQDNDETKNFIQEIKNHYTNLDVELVKIDPQAKSADQVYNHSIILNMTGIKHESLVKFFSKTATYLLFLQNTIKDDEIKAHSAVYRDIFPKPLDRSYFYKKLKIHLSALKETDQSHLVNVTSKEKLKVANIVKISEICELFVTITYSRELPFKSFREFVFIGEDETQAIELPAFCHFVDTTGASKGQDGKASITHQFVFFAMTDHYLKQIRLWLLQNYINKNQKD